MKRFLKSSLGYTALEALVWVGVLAGVGALAVGVIPVLLHLKSGAVSEADLQRQSDALTERVENELRSAELVSLDAPSATSTESSAVFFNRREYPQNLVRLYAEDGALKESNEDVVTGEKKVTTLSSGEQEIAGVVFTKQRNERGSSGIGVTLTLTSDNASESSVLVNALRSQIAKIYAATFDATLLPPDATGNSNVGSPAQRFGSGYIKDKLIVNGKIGVKNTSPVYDLDITGEIQTSATATFAGNLIATSSGKVKQGGYDLMPSGAIMYYSTTSTCPTGWSEYTLTRGRYIVGLNSGGTLATTTGSALSDMENRVVGPHTHNTSNDSHTHVAYGKRVPAGTSNEITYVGNLLSGVNLLPAAADVYGGVVTTGVTASSTGTNISTTTGTNAPYVQLLVCQKT